MANSNIKLFDENKSNMMTDANYSSDSQRSNGVQTGIASSELQNKFQYQVSLVAYAIAQLMLANGLNALDSDTVSTFVSNLSNSIVQKVTDKASVSDMTTGTSDVKWVTPYLVNKSPKASVVSKTLSSSAWVAGTDTSGQTIYTQTFTVSTATANSQPRIQMDTTAYKVLADSYVTMFSVSNNSGTFTATCLANKPTSDLTFQLTLMEVA